MSQLLTNIYFKVLWSLWFLTRFDEKEKIQEFEEFLRAKFK